MGQVLFDPTGCLDEVDSVVVMFFDAGGYRENIWIKNNIFRRETHLLGQNVVGPLADFGFACKRIGLAFFIKRHHNDCRTITAAQPGLLDEFFLTFFQTDGIHHTFALNTLQPGFNNFPLTRIKHHRHPGDIRFRGNQVEKGPHGSCAIQHPLVHVDINDLCPVIDLLASYLQSFTVVLFQDQPLEPGRTCHVSAFANIHKQGIFPDVAGLQTTEATFQRYLWQPAWWIGSNRFSNGTNMHRCRATAPADDIDKPLFGPVTDLFGQHFRCFIKPTERIGQAGIRMHIDTAISDGRHFFHMRPQFLRPQRTVKTETDRFNMAQRIPECFRCLAGKNPSTGVSYSPGNHHRQFDVMRLEIFIDGKQRRLGIERIEDGFHQQNINPALDQALQGDTVSLAQLIKRDIARTGIIYILGHGSGHGHGAQHAGDKPWFILSTVGISHFPRQLGSRYI